MKVFGHHVYPPILLLAGVDFLSANLAFAAAEVLDDIDTPVSAVLLRSVTFGIAVLIGITGVGLYQGKQRVRIEGVLARVVVGIGIAAVLVAIVDFLFPVGMRGSVSLVALGIALVLLGVARTLLWTWLDHDVFRRQVLVYGAGTRAASLLKLRRASDRRGFNIVGFVLTNGDTKTVDDARVLNIAGSLSAYVEANAIDEIVVAMDDRRRDFPVGELLACKFAGVTVMDLLAFLEQETGRVKADLANPSWFIFSDGFGGRLRLPIATQIADLAGAIALLALAWPFMLLTAVAIALDDGFPVLYRQERVGLAGRTFRLYKFRSMVKNAEVDGQARWAGVSDARITRVGAIMRKLRFDELPQLFNVLLGDMSLVGPRPERPEFVASLSRTIPYYHERHSVKPGITGWAQMNYPYGSSERDAMEKLQFDLYYIKHKSLLFDLMVLVQTAEVVLWRKGAR